MYEKQEWSDVYGETPFNSTRMKHIENGIYENSYESRSNENVDWIKYSDGTMICTMKKTLTVTTLNRPWGNLYVTPIISGYDFPQKFIQPPTVNVNVNSNGNAWYLSGGTTATNERTEAFFLASGVTATSFQCILNYIAIGKWK